MSIQAVKQHFAKHNMAHKIMELQQSSATVELAALAVGTQPCRIAKTMSFKTNHSPILIVIAGDARIDNAKYKTRFKVKAKMLTPEELPDLIGHPAGGVCPFAIKSGVEVYLDQSLKRFQTVYPACGTPNSAIELTIEELEKHSNSSGWVDVCKSWQETE